MRIRLAFIIGFILLLTSCKSEMNNDTSTGEMNSEVVSFFTPDSIKIFGDLYALDKAGKTILLFHQGGSNARGEYAPIIPTLIERGYNILAVDQRVGGQYYGSYNRTLANIPDNHFGDGYGFCDAYNNLESALDYVIDSGFSGEKIIWGSSYSASLAIQLVSQRQTDIDGVLAFSPASGGPMQDCIPDEHFEEIEIPMMLLRPPNEMESENSRLQFELAQSLNHQTYVPNNGVHGSSMLVEDRVGGDVAETWSVVLEFLDEI